MATPTAPLSPELQELLAKALARLDAMSPEEKRAHWAAQRDSFVRGQLAFGSDADEARERQAYFYGGRVK